MATNYYKPGTEAFPQVCIGINPTNDYLLPVKTVATGSNVSVSLPFGKSATRWAVKCSGGATASVQTTNDTITDATTADAATWVTVSSISANSQDSGIILSPAGGIRVAVATAGTAQISILCQTQGRNNLG
jgi:hypothetical protein